MQVNNAGISGFTMDQDALATLKEAKGDVSIYAWYMASLLIIAEAIPKVNETWWKNDAL